MDLNKGRIDRLFCDYRCKNKYHNRAAFADKLSTGRIRDILDENRKILKEMAGMRDADQIPRERLLKKGFEFDYHTHFKLTKYGNYTYTFCFDYGYRELKDGYGKKDRFKVVKAFEDKES